MAQPTSSVARTTIGPNTLGKMCRSRMRRSRAPDRDRRPDVGLPPGRQHLAAHQPGIGRDAGNAHRHHHVGDARSPGQRRSSAPGGCWETTASRPPATRSAGPASGHSSRRSAPARCPVQPRTAPPPGRSPARSARHTGSGPPRPGQTGRCPAGGWRSAAGIALRATSGADRTGSAAARPAPPRH